MLRRKSPKASNRWLLWSKDHATKNTSILLDGPNLSQSDSAGDYTASVPETDFPFGARPSQSHEESISNVSPHNYQGCMRAANPNAMMDAIAPRLSTNDIEIQVNSDVSNKVYAEGDLLGESKLNQEVRSPRRSRKSFLLADRSKQNDNSQTSRKSFTVWEKKKQEKQKCKPRRSFSFLANSNGRIRIPISPSKRKKGVDPAMFLMQEFESIPTTNFVNETDDTDKISTSYVDPISENDLAGLPASPEDVLQNSTRRKSLHEIRSTPTEFESGRLGRQKSKSLSKSSRAELEQFAKTLGYPMKTKAEIYPKLVDGAISDISKEEKGLFGGKSLESGQSKKDQINKYQNITTEPSQDKAISISKINQKGEACLEDFDGKFGMSLVSLALDDLKEDSQSTLPASPLDSSAQAFSRNEPRGASENEIRRLDASEKEIQRLRAKLRELEGLSASGDSKSLNSKGYGSTSEFRAEVNIGDQMNVDLSMKGNTRSSRMNHIDRHSAMLKRLQAGSNISSSNQFSSQSRAAQVGHLQSFGAQQAGRIASSQNSELEDDVILLHEEEMIRLALEKSLKDVSKVGFHSEKITLSRGFEERHEIEDEWNRSISIGCAANDIDDDYAVIVDPKSQISHSFVRPHGHQRHVNTDEFMPNTTGTDVGRSNVHSTGDDGTNSNSWKQVSDSADPSLRLHVLAAMHSHEKLSLFHAEQDLLDELTFQDERELEQSFSGQSHVGDESSQCSYRSAARLVGLPGTLTSPTSLHPRREASSRMHSSFDDLEHDDEGAAVLAAHAIIQRAQQVPPPETRRINRVSSMQSHSSVSCASRTSSRASFASQTSRASLKSRSSFASHASQSASTIDGRPRPLYDWERELIARKEEDFSASVDALEGYFEESYDNERLPQQHFTPEAITAAKLVPYGPTTNTYVRQPSSNSMERQHWARRPPGRSRSHSFNEAIEQYWFDQEHELQQQFSIDQETSVAGGMQSWNPTTRASSRIVSQSELDRLARLEQEMMELALHRSLTGEIYENL